jgi:hypothetical protein
VQENQRDRPAVKADVSVIINGDLATDQLPPPPSEGLRVDAINANPANFDSQGNCVIDHAQILAQSA